jgi:ribose transport system permease protein
MTTVTTTLPPRTPRFERLRQRYAWTAIVVVIFAVMLGWRVTQVPIFDGFALRTITAGALTVALLAMAQGLVIMTGGINMTVGGLMMLSNCVSAVLMKGQSVAVCILVAVGCIAAAAGVSAVIGWIINISGIPDIVVTLAGAFIFSGAAWLVIRGPGGGTNSAFQKFLVGGLANPIPSIAVMVIMLVAVWIPFSRSRTGLAMFAMGSSKNAAFLAGVNVGATRIKVYLLSGAIVGLAGIVSTAYTGSGDPLASTGMTNLMASVAAAVLGGVALVGGSGGLFAPVIAAMVLGLIPGILLGLGADPNYAQVVQGAVIILVVFVGGTLQMRRRAR